MREDAGIVSAFESRMLMDVDQRKAPRILRWQMSRSRRSTNGGSRHELTACEVLVHKTFNMERDTAR